MWRLVLVNAARSSEFVHARCFVSLFPPLFVIFRVQYPSQRSCRRVHLAIVVSQFVTSPVPVHRFSSPPRAVHFSPMQHCTLIPCPPTMMSYFERYARNHHSQLRHREDAVVSFDWCLVVL